MTTKREQRMEENNKMTKVYFYEPKSGQTIKLNAETGNFNCTEEDKQRAEPNNFTATLQIKMGKRMKARFQWAVNGCKTKKEYRKLKKLRKRCRKNIETLIKIKDVDNPKRKKSVRWIQRNTIGFWMPGGVSHRGAETGLAFLKV